MKTLRKIVEIDHELCDGCGNCVPSCAEGAIEIRDGKAVLVAERYCDGLGACLGDCPTGALRVIEREAEEFDEEAVEEYLAEMESRDKEFEAASPGGCPSARPVTLARSPEAGVSCAEANKPVSRGGEDSALSHWPIQIRLVPPTAPFLKGADLLVAADCVPVAYPSFHRDFLKGRVVLLGCPKFDDTDEYVRRFKEIFQQGQIRSVTVLDMEVPCCSALPAVVRKGAEAAGKAIPIEDVVIGRGGEILERRRIAS